MSSIVLWADGPTEIGLRARERELAARTHAARACCSNLHPTAPTVARVSRPETRRWLLARLVYFRLALVKACDRKRTREEHSRAAGRDLPRCRHGVGHAPREASSEHKVRSMLWL